MFSIYAKTSDATNVDLTTLKYGLVNPGTDLTPFATSDFTGIMPLLSSAIAMGNSTPIAGVTCTYVDPEKYPAGISLPEVILRRTYAYSMFSNAPANQTTDPVGIFNGTAFINSIIKLGEAAFGTVLKGFANAQWQSYADYVAANDTGASLNDQPAGNIARALFKGDPARITAAPLVPNLNVPTLLPNTAGVSASYTPSQALASGYGYYNNFLAPDDTLVIPLIFKTKAEQTYLAHLTGGPTSGVVTNIPNLPVSLEIKLTANPTP